MSGYPPGSGNPYGAPAYGSSPYGGQQQYGAPQQYGASAAGPYGGGAQPSAPYGAPPAGEKPPKGQGGYQPSAPPYSGGGGYQQPAALGGGGYQQPAALSGYQQTASLGGGGYHQPASLGGGGYLPPAAQSAYGSPFAALVPSAFPPGTDPNVVACFQAADQDGSGFIDDKELQRALSSYNQTFSIRTVRLLMYLFTSSNVHKIGPKEFVSVFYSLQNWRAIFERSDRDRSGKIDVSELRDALMSLGFSVSPTVLQLLVSKFDKTGGKNNGIEYDNFIECCLTVKGLTEKFKEKDVGYTGSATFTYENFMLTVLPFLIA